MNSLKTPLLAIATAIATCSTAVGALGAQVGGIGTTINLPNTPDDGMICRGGYTAKFNGRSLTCSKTVTVKVVLSCTDAKLSKYVARAVGSGGTPDGLDICVKDNPKVGIDSATDISGMTKGVDYVFAKADEAKIAEKVSAQDLAEATALGLQPSEVDTLAGESTVLKNDAGIIDKAQVILTQFTFPITNSGFIVVGP